MLHAVAELAEHAVGYVERILGDEIDAHPLERISRTTCSIFSSRASGHR